MRGSPGPFRRLPVVHTLAAVLWDLDGTLVDTESAWIAAEHRLVADAGGQWTDELAHDLVGRDLRESAALIRANSPVALDDVTLITTLMRQVIDTILVAMPWRPGAVELLADLREHGVACALVTMSWTPLARVVIEALPPGTFAAVVTGDRVRWGKPHPQPYAVACAELGVDPQACLAIEDSPTGLASAVAAGIPTLAVPNVVPVPARAGSTQVATLAGLDLADLRRLRDLARASGDDPR